MSIAMVLSRSRVCISMQWDVIRAKYRLNALNKPLVTINRRSGQISVQGTAPYSFRGTCDLIDGQEHRRFWSS